MARIGVLCFTIVLSAAHSPDEQVFQAYLYSMREKRGRKRG